MLNSFKYVVVPLLAIIIFVLIFNFGALTRTEAKQLKNTGRFEVLDKFSMFDYDKGRTTGAIIKDRNSGNCFLYVFPSGYKLAITPISCRDIDMEGG